MRTRDMEQVINKAINCFPTNFALKVLIDCMLKDQVRGLIAILAPINPRQNYVDVEIFRRISNETCLLALHEKPGSLKS